MFTSKLDEGPRRKSVSFAVVLVAMLIATFPLEQARAFQILALGREACHEKMTLGTLDRFREPFATESDESLEGLLEDFSLRLQGAFPLDAATEGFIKEVSNRFGLNHLPGTERLILASFVAGARKPDTDGFAIVDVNRVRELHIQDDQQAVHFLRRSTIDGANREIETIQEVKKLIFDLVARVRVSWNEEAIPTSFPLLQKTRWTFAFYGEGDVTVFGPAFELGQIAHVVQDSYAHTVRDEEFRILAIDNYVDLINGEHDEARDGPAHSDRMDQCNVDMDAFDRMRVTEASRSTAEVFNEIRRLLLDPMRTTDTLDSILNQIFSRREGCDLSNRYCGSSWYDVGLTDITQPLSIAICGRMAVRRSHQSGAPPVPPPAPMLAFLPFVAVLLFFVYFRFCTRAQWRSVGCGLAFLTVLLLSPAQAHAFQDPTQGRPFLPWLWHDQVVPTAKIAFDQDGLELFAGGVGATVVAHDKDDEARHLFKDHRVLPTELSQLGSFWGSGFPGVGIAVGQLFLDPEAGLIHGRALALTSLSHVSIALVVRRPRPNKDENVSFPSGHTASAFTTATALTYSYGWPIGIPAFFLASLVGTARLHDDVHYLSDVVAAAALGVFWGRASVVLAKQEKNTETSNVSRTSVLPLLLDGGGGVSVVTRF